MPALQREKLWVGALEGFQQAERHVLTFRSWRDPSKHQSMLLFHFASAPGDDTPPTLYAMEESCPHLGASLEAAALEDADIEDLENPDKVLVCPWHQYDFSISTGQSSTGMKACTFGVETRGDQVWIEPPGDAGDDWRLISVRAVSERFAESTIPLPSPILDPSTPPKTLRSFCRLVLLTSNPSQKVALTRTLAQKFKNGELMRITSPDDLPLPDIPPRENVTVVEGNKVGKRGKGGSVASRAKLLHALAWIELWAIDLAIDVISRFAEWKVGSLDGKTGKKLPLSFFADFLKVAQDEAKHFTILRERIEQMGYSFGEFSVHNGLWQSATETMDSLFSRIAVINLVSEARGMDVNPMQIQRCKAAGDQESADVMTTIHNDEITHVAVGHRHFQYLCQNASPPLDPIAKFRSEVAANFHGKLKGPFNVEDREQAGLTPEWYENLEGKLPPAGLATAKVLGGELGVGKGEAEELLKQVEKLEIAC